MDAFDVGQTVGGKYRIERVVGRGGMGLVVEAQHLVLSARVAIKFLAPELTQNAEATARFLREARTTYGIRSPHIVSVLDVGHTETGLPFIVMEYLDGEDVSARLQRVSNMTEAEALEILRQAALGVAFAHSRGIIHRDLKPSNLLCSEAGGVLTVKVVDFGISKLTQDSPLVRDNLITTQTATVLGSPLYMAPEQLQSAKHLDEGCDIWALGVILFELLAGRPPFLGKSITEVAINVATQEPPRLTEFRPDVSPQVQAIVSRCLRKPREERYLTVFELLADVERALTSPAEPGVAAPSAVLEPKAILEPEVAASRPTAAEPASASPRPVSTLTLDGAPAAASLTHSPVSNTQPPPGFARRKWAKLGTAAALMTLTLVVGRLVTQPSTDGETYETPVLAASHASYPSPETTGSAPQAVTRVVDVTAASVALTSGTLATASGSVSRVGFVPQANTEPTSPAADSAATRKPAVTSGRDDPRAAASPSASGGRAAPKAPAPCVPYTWRNGVRVFNDACILQGEAKKGRVSPRSESSKSKQP